MVCRTLSEGQRGPYFSVEVDKRQSGLELTIGEILRKICDESFLVDEFGRRDRTRAIQNNNKVDRFSALTNQTRKHGVGKWVPCIHQEG